MQDRHDALKPGTVLEGFRIERVLGAGSFGITYLAFDLDLRRNVAIKEFLPTGLAQRAGGAVRPLGESQRRDYSWGLDRFLEEARTLVQLRHPNIVTVLRRFDANGTAYMVMDYVEGDSLFARIERARTLGEAEIVKFVYPLLDGLKAVHGAGFLHRDIKPGNIFIRADGAPVLLDFGAARAAVGHATHTLTAIVSDGYAPFEQYGEDGDQGPWSDLYAIGATLYACITGERPPKAPARVKAVFEGKRDPLVPAAERGSGRYSPRLLAAVDRALSIQERDRPQSVAAMLELLGAEPRQSVPAGPPPVAPKPVELEKTNAGSRYVGTVAPPRASRRGWAVAAILLVLAGGGYLGHELIQRGRIEAQRREVDRLIAEARDAIRAGRFQDAERLINRAATLDPRAPALAAALQELAAAIRARDEAEARRQRRAALMQTCLDEHGGRVGRMDACTHIIEAGDLSGEELATAYASRCGARIQYYYRADRGIPDCERAIAMAPRLALAYAYRAVAHWAHENSAEAYRDIRTALSLAPNLVRAHTIHCSFLNVDKKLTEALAACQRALDLDPNDYEARITRGTAFGLLKRNSEALADFSEGVRRRPNLADGYRRRGLHYMLNVSDYTRAMADFDAAIRAEPDHGGSYRVKGLLQWHLKRYDDAYRTFTTGIERDLYFSANYYSRATMQEEQGRKEAAIADFRKVLERNPRHHEARAGLQRLGASP